MAAESPLTVPLCPACSYQLTGLAGHLDVRCPECGGNFAAWQLTDAPTLRRRLWRKLTWWAAAVLALAPTPTALLLSWSCREPMAIDAFFANGGHLPLFAALGLTAWQLGRRDDWYLWAMAATPPVAVAYSWVLATVCRSLLERVPRWGL